MLGANIAPLGLDPDLTGADFQAAVDRTRGGLGEAADLAIDAVLEGGQLIAAVTVRNLTGHKLPSGFPSRRMWLHVRVSDAFDVVIFDSGAADAEGRLANDTAFNDPACLAVDKPDGFDSNPCYEPHRDTITTADQVALYEAVMADTRGDITHVLLHAAGYLKDNRLPPAGFLESGPDFVPETAATGIGGDGDFNVAGSGTDIVTFRIEVPAADAPFTVSADLAYQSIRPSFVDGMHAGGEAVATFKALYQAVPPPVEVLANASAVVGGKLLFADGSEA